MCNPRRIQITATRQINQAWEREVSRTVELRGLATGQARVLQQLGPTVGVPALQAMRRLLEGGVAGWESTDTGYRYSVEGGYIVYDPDRESLEIVAECQDLVSAIGDHTERLTGLVQAEATESGEGMYYTDGWGGRTRQKGEKEARENAERKLDREQQRLVRQAAEDAEKSAESTVEEAARRAAAERLERAAAERHEQLVSQARSNLRQVGIRARQSFHQLLARGYQEAILDYARARGALITCNDDQGDTIDIEFRMTS